MISAWSGIKRLAVNAFNVLHDLPILPSNHIRQKKNLRLELLSQYNDLRARLSQIVFHINSTNALFFEFENYSAHILCTRMSFDFKVLSFRTWTLGSCLQILLAKNRAWVLCCFPGRSRAKNITELLSSQSTKSSTSTRIFLLVLQNFNFTKGYCPDIQNIWNGANLSVFVYPHFHDI